MTNEEAENAPSHLTTKVNRHDREVADMKHAPALTDPLAAAIDAVVLQLTKALVQRQAVSNNYLRLLSRNKRDK
ncbi:hypothetical protein ASE73_07640 [Sphingomonas sp. Leaf24]|uniref:hypothetical protein n=1 Tax=unclassified Sphingomonas TaxID=196159 RepID=UPI000701C41C|nr:MULTISPECIES: hypothetical protein [unclassified Sphingomonas]KQM20185.1 hypothetical protein ASE50_16750 [Sphingomonas sp. Leaf5]KQM89448.1 hypothetical protein ASE73_07640 [Sphingomonas sp. Leaf24]